MFNTTGAVVYEAGATFEYEAIRAGHFNETRAANKGVARIAHRRVQRGCGVDEAQYRQVIGFLDGNVPQGSVQA